MPRRPPKPKTTIFDTRAERLGTIVGPIRVEVVGDTIWCCGGHVSSGFVYRYADGMWTAHALTFLPNFVLAISSTEAITGGSYGRYARTVDGGQTWTEASVGGTWLICASRDRAGRVWVGQQNGRVFRAKDPTSPLEQVAQVRGSVNTVRQMSETHALVVTEKVAHRIELAKAKVAREPVWETDDENLIDGAIDDEGNVVLVANGGKAWFAKAGKRFRAIDVGAGTLDFDAVFWLDGWFLVLGYDGAVRASLDAKQWTRVAVEKKQAVARLGGIAMYRGGWLVGASRSDSALSGVLAYLGDPANAPLVPTAPPSKPDDLSFVLAERYALLWATTWASLPHAEQHADGWMKLAAAVR